MKKIATSVTDVTTKTGWTTVTAYESGVPGLIIHRPLEKHLDRWNITHKGSGRSVIRYKFRTIDEAARYAQRWLKDMADWTQPDGQIVLESKEDPARFERARGA